MPDSPPPITDTRAESADPPPPITDTRAGSDAAPPPAARTPEEIADERLKAEPVDPWATAEAAALAAGHIAPVSHPPTPTPPAVTSPPPFGAHQTPSGGWAPTSPAHPGASTSPAPPGWPTSPANAGGP